MNVLDLFNRISPKYDRINRLISLGMDMNWRRFAARHLPSARQLSLLDLATGTGDQIKAILETKAPFASITGVDISEEMLQIAKKKLPCVSFLRCNAERLPFAGQSFDVCTISFGIRNVEHPLIALSEMFRVTKRNGSCLILEFSIPRGHIKKLYLFYLRCIMPMIGVVLSQDKTAYRYLHQTIAAFPCDDSFLQMMRQTGWSNLRSFELLFGCVTLYCGEKAPS